MNFTVLKIHSQPVKERNDMIYINLEALSEKVAVKASFRCEPSNCRKSRARISPIAWIVMGMAILKVAMLIFGG